MSEAATIRADVPAAHADGVEEHGVATIRGDGHRSRHSTGHYNGGPPAGRSIQIVHEPAADLDGPGEPYTFARLIGAQADGDLQTLREHGLDAVRTGKEIL